jgi:hypothetical protein
MIVIINLKDIQIISHNTQIQIDRVIVVRDKIII